MCGTIVVSVNAKEKIVENKILEFLKNHPEGATYQSLLKLFDVSSGNLSAILLKNKAKVYSKGSRWYFDQRITAIENWVTPEEGASFTEIFEHFKEDIKSKSTMINLLRASCLVQEHKKGRYYFKI